MCLALYGWRFCSLASHKLGKTVCLVMGLQLPNQCISGSMFRDMSPFMPMHTSHMAHLPIWLNDYHWSFNGLAGAASEGVSGAAAGAGQREEVLAARAPNSPDASCARAEDGDADIHQCRGYHGYWQGRSCSRAGKRCQQVKISAAR